MISSLPSRRWAGTRYKRTRSRAQEACRTNSAGFSISRASTLNLKHEFKRRCGFDLEGVRIPRRILQTATPMGVLDEGFLRQALEVYRQGVLPEAAAV
jgi:hypothetical protein